jgi:hypothetical protein
MYISALIASFLALATLLRFDAECRRWTDELAANADHLACFGAPSKLVSLYPLERCANVEQLRRVTNPGSNRELVLFLGACTIDRIRTRAAVPDLGRGQLGPRLQRLFKGHQQSVEASLLRLAQLAIRIENSLRPRRFALRMQGKRFEAPNGEISRGE